MYFRNVSRDALLTRAAIFLIILAPLLMIPSREITATLLIVVVLLLTGARFAGGHSAPALEDWWQIARHPSAIMLAAMVMLAALSVFWSPTPGRGAMHVIHFAGGIFLGVIAVIIAIYQRVNFNFTLFVFVYLLTTLILLIDILGLGMLRGLIGLQTEPYRTNRSFVAIVLFFPLLFFYLNRKGSNKILILIGILIVSAAVYYSRSQSAKIALLAVFVSLPLGMLLQDHFRKLVALALPMIVVLMPVFIPVINEVIPQSVHDTVGYGSLTIRGEMWRETVPFIWQKPIFGWGIEASHVLPHLPEAAHLSAQQIYVLDWGHTHNAPLQIWLELGLAGAALAAASLYFGIRAMRALPPALLPYALASVIAAFTIACVSHGAWQAWWWALLGLLATAFAVMATTCFPDSIGPRARKVASQI